MSSASNRTLSALIVGAILSASCFAGRSAEKPGAKDEPPVKIVK